MNVHSSIEGAVRPLADGSVVLPKDVVDRLGWTESTELELVRTVDGLAVRPAVPANRKSMRADEVFARIAAIRSAPGPRLSDEEMHDIVREKALENYRRT